MTDTWVKILTTQQDGKWAHRHADWREIMTGPDMAKWIEEQDPATWFLPYPNVYWLSPELYIIWKLRWA
jgi:hypothetical protein